MERESLLPLYCAFLLTFHVKRSSIFVHLKWGKASQETTEPLAPEPGRTGRALFGGSEPSGAVPLWGRNPPSSSRPGAGSFLGPILCAPLFLVPMERIRDKSADYGWSSPLASKVCQIISTRFRPWRRNGGRVNFRAILRNQAPITCGLSPGNLRDIGHLPDHPLADIAPAGEMRKREGREWLGN